MAARDVLRPEKLVGWLAIRETTAEVVNRGCRHSERRRVPQEHGAFRCGGPSLYRTQTKNQTPISHHPFMTTAFTSHAPTTSAKPKLKKQKISPIKFGTNR